MRAPRALLSSCTGLLGLALVILLPRLAAAAWPTDPTVNVPVCTAPNDQTVPQMVSDGAGGAIITWLDNLYGSDSDIYAQHVLASGVVDPAWSAYGCPLNTWPSAQGGLVIVSDGAGGAIVAWQDGDDYVRVQHAQASGAVDPAWPPGGRVVCPTLAWPDYGQCCPTIASDGAGGAILAWDYLGVRAQHVLASGVVDPAWPAYGCELDTVDIYDRGAPQIVADGAGGGIVTWHEDRNNKGDDIWAQHVLASGVADPAWPPNGRALCTAPYDQINPKITSDGAGGAIVTWRDSRGRASYDIYAQHVLASGVTDPAWPVDGRAMCTAANAQFDPTIVGDGAGGAIVTWWDGRNSANFDIYAQHVPSNGALDPAWPADGRALCTAPNLQAMPAIVSDAAGGAIVTWQDNRSGTYSDIYAQHVLRTGVVDPVWPADGRAVCTAPNNQTVPQIVSDGEGGAIVAWQDYRNGTSADIYAQRVLANGQLGGDVPTPTLVSLVTADVRDGVVRLRWYVSLDEPVTLTVYRSTVAGVWQALGTVTPDGSGYVRYEDARVTAGARYGYRLGLRPASGPERYAGEAWVDVPPASADLALRVPSPVVGGEVTASFGAPAGRSVRVSLLDLAGRVVAARLVPGGSGRQSVDLARSSDLAPGVYLVRLDLDRPVVARVAVIR